MNKRVKNSINIVLIIMLVLFLIFFIAMIGPERIVETFGVRNSYLVLFLFAIFGGVSAFTSTSFYATVGALYLGGLNLFVLAVIGALGLNIGDSLFYYLGRKGRGLLAKEKFKEKIDKLKNRIEKFSEKAMFIFIYIYSGVTFFPKDVLCVVLGMLKYPYIKTMIPLFFGNLTFNIIFLVLVSQGFNFGIKLI